MSTEDRQWFTEPFERRSNATLDVPPTPDIATLEAAAEALARNNEIGHAVAVWAIVLRMRMEANR